MLGSLVRPLIPSPQQNHRVVFHCHRMPVTTILFTLVPLVFCLPSSLTALDAAGPGFEDTEPECRLDESDALFVDAIHTDSSTEEGGGIGITQRVK